VSGWQVVMHTYFVRLSIVIVTVRILHYTLIWSRVTFSVFFSLTLSVRFDVLRMCSCVLTFDTVLCQVLLATIRQYFT